MTGLEGSTETEMTEDEKVAAPGYLWAQADVGEASRERLSPWWQWLGREHGFRWLVFGFGTIVLLMLFTIGLEEVLRSAA